MEFNCEICNKLYASYQSLWKHKRKFHTNNEIIEITNKKYYCKFCLIKFNNRQSKWRHEKSCDKFNKTHELEIKIEKMEKEMEKLKTEPKINNITNNINKGIINNFFSQPGSERINMLNEKEIEYILDQELNSVIKVIEYLNFSTHLPENHTFCSTSINDKHINVINPETTLVEKRIKKEFIEQLLAPGINKVKMLYEKIDPSNPKRQKYKEKIDNLVSSLIVNNKGRKVFVDAINVLTYNNRHKVLLTWEQIKQGQIPDTKFILDNDVKPMPDLNKIFYNKDLLELDNTESSDTDEEQEPIKIEYKKKFYILDNNILFEIVNGKKGSMFGYYKSGRVIVNKEINL